MLLLITSLVSCAITAVADDDKELRRLLSLLSGVHIGDDYDAVKKLVPEIGALHTDAGEPNTEALVTTRVGKIEIEAVVQPSKGGLVSRIYATGRAIPLQSS